MSISLAEIHHPDEFINRGLRAMARQSRKTGITTWYRVCCHGQEVAFLAVGRSGERLVPYQPSSPFADNGPRTVIGTS
jgi:hypothetical protein